MTRRNVPLSAAELHLLVDVLLESAGAVNEKCQEALGRRNAQATRRLKRRSRASWPGLSRTSTSLGLRAFKTWMPGTGPGMTE